MGYTETSNSSTNKLFSIFITSSILNILSFIFFDKYIPSNIFIDYLISPFDISPIIFNKDSSHFIFSS